MKIATASWDCVVSKISWLYDGSAVSTREGGGVWGARVNGMYVNAILNIVIGLGILNK